MSSKVSESTQNTSLILNYKKKSSDTRPYEYKCRHAIIRMAADLLAVSTTLALGMGIGYIEYQNGIDSKLVVTITGIGIALLTCCSYSIVHYGCNIYFRVGDPDYATYSFIPYTPH